MLPFLQNKEGSASLPVESIKRDPDNKDSSHVKEDLRLIQDLVAASLESPNKQDLVLVQALIKAVLETLEKEE